MFQLQLDTMHESQLAVTPVLHSTPMQHIATNTNVTPSSHIDTQTHATPSTHIDTQTHNTVSTHNNTQTQAPPTSHNDTQTSGDHVMVTAGEISMNAQTADLKQQISVMQSKNWLIQSQLVRTSCILLEK